MTPNPFFSVVIPTYNRGHLIEKTLESVFTQTYVRYEVIVVDNCSTDRTADILRPYSEDGRILFIQNERNFERARSRNIGMDNAKGEFLSFLDSDDFMYPDNLEDAARFAEQNPDLKCFHNLYELVDQNGAVIYRYRFPSLHNQIRAISDGNFMGCIGNFIHRDIYLHYAFDEMPDLTGGEDWEFWLRVLADHKLGRIEKVNNGAQHHEGRSISSQNIDRMRSGLSFLVQKFRGHPHLSAVYANHLNRIEANSFLYLNLLANDAGLSSLAARFLWSALVRERRILFGTRFVRSLRRTLITALRRHNRDL